MTPESIIQCPICNNNSFKHFLSCTDYTTSHESFPLVKCTQCSFVITSPRPRQSEIGKYYESDQYISHTGGSKSLIDKIYLIARTYSLKRKRSLIETYSEKGSLLDYGSGTGHFIEHSAAHGWDCTGIEPSENARKKTNTNLQVSLYQSLKDIKQKKFNVITLWHVLEHVHELNSTLTDLSSMLIDKGMIFIAVPNHESFDAIKYQNEWAAYDVPRHLWHFNKENISKLLSNHGLTLVDIKPMKLDSFYVSLLSEGYKNPAKSKLIRMSNAFFTGLISNWKGRKEINYSSLIYIVSK